MAVPLSPSRRAGAFVVISGQLGRTVEVSRLPLEQATVELEAWAYDPAWES